MHPDLVTDFRAAKRAAAALAGVLKADIIQRGELKLVRFRTGRQVECKTWLEVYGHLAAVRADQVSKSGEPGGSPDERNRTEAAELIDARTIPMALPVPSRGERLTVRGGRLNGQRVEILGPCPTGAAGRFVIRTVDGQRWSVALERLQGGAR